ncbi:MAG: hypothetical protein K2X47_16180 [Bdellovibrionales bacterium]|nr:hypothetical protein [Bdellovibrionales bacterium]
MPDAVATSLCGLIIGVWSLFLRREHGSLAGKTLIVAIGFVTGLLMTIKPIFVYWAPLLSAAGFGIFLWKFRPNRRSAMVAVSLFFVALSVPHFFSYRFLKIDRPNSYALENFAGQGVLANILPLLSCEELSSALVQKDKSDWVLQNCNPEELSKTESNEQLWNSASFLRRLMSQWPPESGPRRNLDLISTSVRILLRRPQVILLLAEPSMKDFIAANTWPLSFHYGGEVAKGCITLFKELFRGEPEEHAFLWAERYEQKRDLFLFLTFFGRTHLSFIHILSLVVSLAIPFLVATGKRPKETLLIVLGFWGYLTLAILGSRYDMRSYMPATLLGLLCILSVIGLRSRPSRGS